MMSCSQFANGAAPSGVGYTGTSCKVVSNAELRKPPSVRPSGEQHPHRNGLLIHSFGTSDSKPNIPSRDLRRVGHGAVLGHGMPSPSSDGDKNHSAVPHFFSEQ